MRLKAIDHEPVDPGDYPARFTGYEEDEGVHGAFVKMHFELVDGEHAGKILTGIASAKFNPLTKLWAWVEALLRRAIRTGEEIDLDDLIGRKCIISVEHQKTERGIFERIATLRPVPEKKGRPEPEADEEKSGKGNSDAKSSDADDFDDLPF